ncbi:cytochrome P450 [Aspergillus nidulans var. acristatus]
MDSFLLLSIPTVFVILLVTRSWTRRLSSSIPDGLRELPGPKGYPLIGNLLDIPKVHSYLAFHTLSKIYGPIFRLNIFGTTHLIISSAQIADDLMARRGAIYSDRGNLHMVRLVTGGGDVLAASSAEDYVGPAGETGSAGYWRRARRFSVAMLTPKMAERWEPFQEKMARRMVIDMVRDPGRYVYWFDRYASAVGLREVYGIITEDEDEAERHTKRIAERMHNIERIATPGGYLVELIPALMYLPAWLAPFKKEARRLHEIESRYFRELWDTAKKRYMDGEEKDPPSFARCLLADPGRWEISDEAEAMYVLGTLYGGGSGTTANAMQSFVLAMVLHPEWQRRVQREVDSVVGERVPGFEDMPRLPLVRAVVKEVLRWRPVVAGNIPHRLTQNDTYDGYHIPAESLVHGNQWAIHRDESLYPNPETFNPARFLEKGYPTYKEPLTRNPNIKRFSAFGFGRRICPGIETADRSLFIQVLLFVWACTVSKKVDENGNEVDVPWYDYTEGVNVMPKRFEFCLVGRGGRVEVLGHSLELA